MNARMRFGSPPVSPGAGATALVQAPDSGSGLEADAIKELDFPCRIQFPNSPESICEVRIRRVNTGFIKLYSQNRIPLNSRVQLLFKNEVLNADVAYCTQQGEGYFVGLSFGARGISRRELRIPIDFPAQLTIPGHTAPITVRLTDMSPTGLGLDTPIAILAGTTAAIESACGTAFGEVRFCVPKASYYRVGIALEEIIPSERQHECPPSVKAERTSKPSLLGTIKQALLPKPRS